MNVSIIGSGVYAKALANVLLENKCKVTMWTELEDISNVLVPKDIKVTNNFEVVMNDSTIVYILTSSKFCKSIFMGIKPFYKDQILVLGSKGILDDGTILTDLLEEIILGAKCAVISGPTFAVDIAALEPVGFTVGTKNKEDFLTIKKSLSSIYLEYSSEVNAIEMAGSLKNAYAIGSGILSCFNYGNSTRCLYITRALKEIEHVYKELKMDTSSVVTLAVIGDLMLTCTSPNSRNFTFGTILSLESSEDKKSYLKNNTVEGYENLKVFVKLFKEKNIDVPLLSRIYEIVANDENPKKLIELILCD